MFKQICIMYILGCRVCCVTCVFGTVRCKYASALAATTDFDRLPKTRLEGESFSPNVFISVSLFGFIYDRVMVSCLFAHLFTTTTYC